MSAPVLSTRAGGCLCGAVRFTAGLNSHDFSACHCSMCQRISGGVNMSFAVPAGAMAIEGEDKVVTYHSSEEATRSFCGVCGSNLWYRGIDSSEEPQDYHVAFGLLDDKAGMVFAQEICIDSKPDSYAFVGTHPRKTTAEALQ